VKKSLYQLSGQFDKISCYVVAHADDWQLFMHPNVYIDLTAHDCKVIFIITTAGDAGMGERYWKAREEGSKSSVRFCLAPSSSFSETSGKRKFNDHTVHYWSVNNTTTYFLRLPDGNMDGSGFPDYNFQSLFRLRSGQINAVTALDKSTTYHSWSEFVTDIESMITFESQGMSNIWIHYLNPDKVINPDDHTDHITTGNAIQDMTIIRTLHQLLFAGYSVSSVQEHLPSKDLFWKAGMFAVYEKAVHDFCGYSTLRENTDAYLRWCCSRPKFLTVLPTPSE